MLPFLCAKAVKYQMSVRCHPGACQAGLCTCKCTAIQRQNGPAALRKPGQRGDAAAYTADAGHFREPFAVQFQGQPVGELRHAGATRAGVDEGKAVGHVLGSQCMSQPGRSLASSQFFTIRPSSVSPLICRRRWKNSVSASVWPRASAA